jgi:hypothetical protein
MLTATTCRIEPWDSDAVAFFNVFYTSPDLSHVADAFVTRDEGWVRLHWPVAGSGMKISMADTTGFYFHNDFPSFDLRLLYVTNV